MTRSAVLVIDDNASHRANIATILADESFGVSQAASAKDATILAERVRPDIVILDLSRPRSGGRALAREIKTNFPEIAIVAVSAPSTDLPSLADGVFAAALARPFDHDELVDLVRGLCPRGWSSVSVPPSESARHVRPDERIESSNRLPWRHGRVRSRLSRPMWLRRVLQASWPIRARTG